MSYIKHNVAFKEFMMHEYIYNMSLSLDDGVLNVPKINDYDVETQVMTMENVPHMCVSDFYGDDAADISVDLFYKIREVIRVLYKHHIIYPDITGYNFIEYDGKLWIIDFEHSDFRTHQKNVFVDEFVTNDEYYKWNPWFA
jgi:tRNA A-37 threonylcarbamoyl transferase component Bud32